MFRCEYNNSRNLRASVINRLRQRLHPSLRKMKFSKSTKIINIGHLPVSEATLLIGVV
jgi:hypothetical protein